MSWRLDPGDRGRAVAVRGRLLAARRAGRGAAARRARASSTSTSATATSSRRSRWARSCSQSIAPIVHAAGGVLDCHLMVEDPERHFAQFARGRRRQRHGPLRGRARTCAGVVALAREHGLAGRARLQPRDERRAGRRGGARGRGRPRALHERPPGLLGPAVHAGGARARARAAGAAAGGDRGSRSTAASARTTSRELRDAGATLFVAGDGDLRARGSRRAPTGGSSQALAVSLERALELARARARAGRAPNPLVGAVRRARTARSSARAGTQGAGRRTPRSRRSRQAGERARGRDALRDARAVLAPRARRRRARTRSSRPASRGSSPGSRDPNPKVDGQGLRAAARRRASRSRSPTRGRRGVQNEAWRVWIARGRPFVTYKVAIDARRAGDRAGLALGHRRGEPAARARAAGGVGRRRRRDGHGAGRRPAR